MASTLSIRHEAMRCVPYDGAVHSLPRHSITRARRRASAGLTSADMSGDGQASRISFSAALRARTMYWSDSCT